MSEEYQYDVSRIANFGRDTARAYNSFQKSSLKLTEEINKAIDHGVPPVKITHDMLGRCSTREAGVDLMTSVIALAQMGKIPQSVADPFDKGVHVRRV